MITAALQIWLSGSVTWCGELALTAAIPLVLELTLPRRAPSIGLTLSGLAYLLSGAPFAALIGSLAGLFQPHIAQLITPAFWHEMPPWARILIFLLAYDFFYYWGHRIQHAFLWRWHATHHSIENLGALNSYHHPSAFLIDWVTILLPLYILGLGEGAVVSLIMKAHGIYLHTASRCNFGPLRWIFNDNRNHRIHHSLEPAHWNKNFAVISPLWDLVFGTAYMQEPNAWPETGLADQQPPASIWGYLAQPFACARP